MDTHNVACWTVPLAIQVSVTRKWKKMVNKLRRWWSQRHSWSFLWPSPPIWRRGRGLRYNNAPHKAKRESIHIISPWNGRFTIVIFLFLFWDYPLMNWPCRSASRTLKSWSVFIRTQQNPCTQCTGINVRLLLLYQFKCVLTFHDSARSAQLRWAMSGTRHILTSCISATALLVYRFTLRKIFFLLHSGLQADNVPRFCRQWHHQPKKYLKTKCVDKNKALIPRRSSPGAQVLFSLSVVPRFSLIFRNSEKILGTDLNRSIKRIRDPKVIISLQRF